MQLGQVQLHSLAKQNTIRTKSRMQRTKVLYLIPQSLLGHILSKPSIESSSSLLKIQVHLLRGRCSLNNGAHMHDGQISGLLTKNSLSLEYPYPLSHQQIQHHVSCCTLQQSCSVNKHDCIHQPNVIQVTLLRLLRPAYSSCFLCKLLCKPTSAQILLFYVSDLINFVSVVIYACSVAWG